MKAKLIRHFRKAVKKLDKHLPAILTTASVVIGGAALIQGIHAGVETGKYVSENPEATKKDIVKHTWRPYTKALVLAILSGSCAIGAHKVNAKRLAAVSTTLALMEDKYDKLEEKVKDVVGEKKTEKVKDKIADDQAKKASESQIPDVIEGTGHELFQDPVTGKWFWSSAAKIQQAALKVQEMLISGYEEEVTLNSFYKEIDQDISCVDVGDIIVFTRRCYPDYEFCVKGSPYLTLDGRAFGMLNYNWRVLGDEDEIG